MSKLKSPWLKWINDLQSIAQIGLAYTNDPYDRERFEAILIISSEIAAEHSGIAYEKISQLFAAESGYATPKLDVRGAVFQDNKILLVRERSDNLWTLPGGWADVNLSPKECVEREILEESGYETRVTKLFALYDAYKQDHPHQWPHIYKCMFICELLGGSAKPSIETSEVKFFSENEIPELSIYRISTAQIQRAFEHYRNPEWPTDFD